MIFKNAEFFNVSDLTPDTVHGGYVLHRLPTSLEGVMAGGGNANRDATGVEIRFVMRGDRVTLRLAAVPEPDNEGQHFIGNCRVSVYYGNMLGGWWDQEKDRHIGEDVTDLVICRPPEMETCRAISRAADFPYAADVVRVLLEPGHYRFFDIIGDIEPPKPEQLPGRRYVAYGSSITHGSLGLSTAWYYPTRVGEYFRAETRNLGFAGSCRLEPEVADALAALDFDVATLEVGINVLGMPEEEFDRRVRNLIATVAGAHPTAEIFCISPFYCHADWRGDRAPMAFRRIVARAVADYASPHVHEINGLSCLGSADGLSCDLVHPSPIGTDRIASALITQMKPYIPGGLV